MDAYDCALVPEQFPLHNSGAICYLNSFLQMLASCSSFTKIVQRHEAFIAQTRTGAAILAYVRCYKRDASGIEACSAAILTALMSDMVVRHPRTKFGHGQQSADEAFGHILEMIDPKDRILPVDGESPVTQLFLHRFRGEVRCKSQTCQTKVLEEGDPRPEAVLPLFHIDRLREDKRPKTPAEFSFAVRYHVTQAEKTCTMCGGPTCWLYKLRLVSEIIVCMFNLFTGGHIARYFPEKFELPAEDGTSMVYRLVAQIEHSGDMNSGHYWARCLRADGNVYRCNDSVVSDSRFGPSPNTFMVAYHYVGKSPAIVQQ